MSNWQFLVELLALASLGGYLWAKHRQRERNRPVPLDPAVWTGKPIDITPLKPSLEKVRSTYKLMGQPQKGACFHRALLALAHHSVARFTYFHDRNSEESTGAQNSLS